MEKDFTPYEQALALKELGFDKPCFASYVKETKEFTTRGFADFYKEQQIYAPTFSQAFRWFREIYDINSFVKREFKDTKMKGYYYGIEGIKKDFYSKTYTTYEEAELECLKKLIEIVKNGNIQK